MTNFNYLPYLRECLDSVERQLRPFDRVIVVDDGSTDGSSELAAAVCREHANWSFIGKENGGQLSCLNAVISLIDLTDIVYFIDADDVYPPDYLALANECFDSVTDFLCCETVPFREGIEMPISTSKVSTDEPIDIVVSSAITRRGRAWVGSPTSALAIRGTTLKQILPYSFEADWKTRADDVLIYGSSIVGARKRWAPSLAVAYRVHGKNNFFGRIESLRDKQIRNIRIERLFHFMSQRTGLKFMPSLLDSLTELRFISSRMRARFFIPNRFRFVFAGTLDLFRVVSMLISTGR